MPTPTKYKSEFNNRVVELGALGYSKTQMAADLKVARITMESWTKNPVYEGFAESLKLGVTLAEAFWEKVGQQGTKGLLAKFCAGSWIFMMKARYRGDWLVENEQNINLNDATRSLTDKELDERLKLLTAVSETRKLKNNGSSGTPKEESI